MNHHQPSFTNTSHHEPSLPTNKGQYSSFTMNWSQSWPTIMNHKYQPASATIHHHDEPTSGINSRHDRATPTILTNTTWSECNAGPSTSPSKHLSNTHLVAQAVAGHVLRCGLYSITCELRCCRGHSFVKAGDSLQQWLESCLLALVGLQFPSPPQFPPGKPCGEPPSPGPVPTELFHGSPESFDFLQLELEEIVLWQLRDRCFREDESCHLPKTPFAAIGRLNVNLLEILLRTGPNTHGVHPGLSTMKSHARSRPLASLYSFKDRLNEM